MEFNQPGDHLGGPNLGDPNAGTLVYESQERYRAQLKSSILALAQRRVTARHLNDATHRYSNSNLLNVVENSREAKSVAAQQRDGFARELACVQAENQKLKRQIEDLQGLLRESRLHLRRLSQDITSRQRDESARAAESRIAELLTAAQAKQAELDEANSHVEKLSHDRKNLMDKLDSEEANAVLMRERIAAHESELSRLEHDLEAARQEKTRHANDISALHYELDEALCKMDELQAIISQHDVEREKWQAEVDDLNSHRSELESHCEKSEKHAAALEESLSALQNDLSASLEREHEQKRLIAEYSEQRDKANSALQAMLDKLQSLETEHEHKKKQSLDLEHSLDSAMAKLRALEDLPSELAAEKQAHHDTQDTLSGTLSRAKELEDTIAQNEQARDAINEEIEQLRHQLADSLRANEQIRAAIGNENETVAMQQKMVAELQSQNAELKAKHNIATTTYHKEHARLLATEKRATEAATRCRTLEAQQKESERIIQNLSAENRKLYDERLELAQGFEEEVGLREAMQFKLQGTQFREQCLLAELKEENQKLETLIRTHAQELQDLHDAHQVALAREQELNRQLQAQSQHDYEAEGLHLLRADLVQIEAQLKYEEQKTRRLQNQIQDLKGNIRVVVRVRPSSSTSLNNLTLSSDTVTLVGTQDTCKGLREVARKYHFDRVFGPGASNQAVCEETEYLVQSALDGHNVCIFAYGQTGSGKTWTMGGVDGVSMSAINTVMEAATRSRDSSSLLEYTVTAESVEIYNEQFRDLLGQSPMLTGPVTGFLTGPISRYGRASLPYSVTSSSASSIKESSGVALKMNDKTRLPELVGTRKVEISSAEHARELFSQAARARSVAATAANSRSSRSHFIFLLHIKRRHKHAINGAVQHSVLNLVDLAGSERLAHSKTTGDRLVETTAINSSLSTLGNVIKTLANRGPSRANERTGTGEHTRPLEYLTYRDSKLTFLLQGSLSGDSKAMLLATLSPEADHANETRSTLQFAETASRATVRQ